MKSQKFFELYWSWHEDYTHYLFYHPNKTVKEFEKDIKFLFKKYGEEYLKKEESWAGAPGWIEQVAEKLPELGYEKVKPNRFGHFGSYIIKGDDELKDGEIYQNEEDKEFSKLVGKTLLKKAIQKNKDFEYELEHGEKKLTAKKRLENL